MSEYESHWLSLWNGTSSPPRLWTGQTSPRLTPSIVVLAAGQTPLRPLTTISHSVLISMATLSPFGEGIGVEVGCARR